MIEFIQNHWAEIGVALLSIHTIAKAVTDATETQEDDKIVARIGYILAYLFAGRRPK